MPATIADIGTVNTEIVLSERRVTNEFLILEIHEHIRQRFVNVEIELGPFTTETYPDGSTETRGTSRRGIVVWENTSYDAVRDTWSNVDLLARITTILNSQFL